MPRSASTITAKIDQKNLTALIREHKPSAAGKEVYVWDHKTKGFGLRLRAGAAATYICRHALGRTSLGAAGVKGAKTVAEARAEAVKHSEAAKLSGGRVHIRRRERAKDREERSAIRLSKVIEAYLLDAKERMRERYYAETARHLRQDWKALHSRPANAIDRDAIVHVLDGIEARGKVAADRARAALSSMFSWAINRDYGLGLNPALGLTARSPANGGRSRVLELGELVEVWKAAGNDSYGRIVKLLLLTGQRRDEIGALAWAEIKDNCTGLQIELPAKRVKNHRDHIVPLADQAVALLPSKQDGHRYLFGRYGGAPFGGWSKSKAELDERILEARRKIDPKAEAMPPWVIHDLRRSMATHCVELGIGDRDLVEVALNHRSGSRGGITGVYQRAERLAERRLMLSKWAEHIARLVE